MKILYIIGRIILAGLLLYGVYLEAGPFTALTLFLMSLVADINVGRMQSLHRQVDKYLLTGRKS